MNKIIRNTYIENNEQILEYESEKEEVTIKSKYKNQTASQYRFKLYDFLKQAYKKTYILSKLDEKEYKWFSAQDPFCQRLIEIHVKMTDKLINELKKEGQI